jgi:hypothetical protein
VCHLGAVVVSVLATGPKGRGFRPGRGDGFLRAIKIRSTHFFGWEVKPEVLCRNGMLKIPWDISYTSMQNSHSSCSSSYLPKMSLLVGLPESSGGRVRSYPERASSLPSLSMLTSPGRWWKFWDIVSPHHNHQSICQSKDPILIQIKWIHDSRCRPSSASAVYYFRP